MRSLSSIATATVFGALAVSDAFQLRTAAPRLSRSSLSMATSRQSPSETELKAVSRDSPESELNALARDDVLAFDASVPAPSPFPKFPKIPLPNIPGLTDPIPQSEEELRVRPVAFPERYEAALDGWTYPPIDALVQQTPEEMDLTDQMAIAGTRLELRDSGNWWLKTGLFFLSCGIATGGWWAQSAWGAFWSWDPKENASLYCWLAFSFYLHVSQTPSLRKIQYPTLVFGMLSIFYCFLGTNFFTSGLHSYGFLQ
uniref:Cytochrome c assembly protein domain-containing protein n=1 Tax=Chromera velia CCMP2878 TaxID=1169474 RepID=A0A0G4FJ33_9ALVE|mmetsp:Transcript_15360/g.31158  ORF Transcript_15360/g.31158 Transcript_15360/m.31158 type:complete len:256 (-) Transcript_15360:1922-2689(-)|eukprot:Cvel_17213.t1-p1 / transcript=Cvel_17213.t1 / gene=Cvel_17213 / organism=Chromera_velia_CCMP2878 / gene_product=Cytochrome c biogenesis protein ccsA, putative / transcript_product=Cytochrome c biogenesis protein ccsA, putative / location=Cvel_scaffold1361:39578-40342(+) / protein_length=255 / sequence_SO=supercontig / SO=protein_coding / is_pseudo=false